MHARYFMFAAALLLATPAAAPAAETVGLPHFRSIELNGGGKVVLRHGAAQRVAIVSGSSAFTDIRVGGRGRREADRLIIDACNRRCPQHYDLQIEIVTPDVPAVAINGGGAIRADAGFPRQSDAAAAVSGGGEIDLRALPVRSMAAAVQGGGVLLVNAGESLAASVTGGGVIRYWGSPSVSTSINGGGSVRPGR